MTLGASKTQLNETFIQIEQIAVLTPLQECTQLGASRVSSDQVGTYDGSTSLQMASGAALALPASCSGVSIPLGAPVLVFRIERPAAPVTEMARTEFRSVPCENDGRRALQQRGTMVQSRVVRYTAEGVITPSDPNVGWATEELGNCVSDAIVTADGVANAEGGSIALDNFADLAAQGMEAAGTTEDGVHDEQYLVRHSDKRRSGGSRRTAGKRRTSRIARRPQPRLLAER